MTFITPSISSVPVDDSFQFRSLDLRAAVAEPYGRDWALLDTGLARSTGGRRVTQNSGLDRNLFYRAATALVDLALEGDVTLSPAEAVAVLLQTWNISFYRFQRRFDLGHVPEVLDPRACENTTAPRLEL